MSPTALNKERDGNLDCARDPIDHRLPPGTIRAVQDTAAGCRIRADADLLAAVATSTDNHRQRLETSAASWSARAALSQAMDDDLQSRKWDLRGHRGSKSQAQ